MSHTEYLISIASTLFRALSFVFLRIIPLRICKTVIPLSYIAYASLVLVISGSGPDQRSTTPRTSKDALETQRMVPEDAKRGVQTPAVILKYIKSFVLTLPSPSPRMRNLSLATNTLLLLFVLDFITHPIRYPARDTVFSRIGAVDHTSAKISVRYPQPQIDSDGTFDIKLVYRPVSESGDTGDAVAWIDGPVLELRKGSDWIGSTTIANLWPNTTYQYKLVSNISSHDLPYPTRPLEFRTFPDPRLVTGSHFKFIAASCILPNFPYVPGKGDKIKGFDMLADYISVRNSFPRPRKAGFDPSHWDDRVSNLRIRHDDDAHAPVQEFSHEKPGSMSDSDATSTEFLLFLGDFIYADVPVYFGDSKEAYHRLYRRTYASPSFRKIYENLPILHIYDDHEIINNYAGEANDSTYPFPNASDAFDLYNAQANHASRHEGQYYYDFRYGDVTFFVMDTRRYRSSATHEDGDDSTMLGMQQMQVLRSWLEEVNQTSTFKFIVSSVPFTTLWQHDAQVDSWAAFKQERRSLLDVLHTVPNVFILSGDRHEFAAIEFNGPFDWSSTVFEFSTSPLSMFYIPLIRTLKMASSEHVERTRQSFHMSTNGSQVLVEERHSLPEEQVIKYLPIGNHKWSSFEVDSRDPSKPTISVEVMIDGRAAFRWSMVGRPQSLKRSTALGAYLPQSLHDVLDKFGLGPRKRVQF